MFYTSDTNMCWDIVHVSLFFQMNNEQIEVETDEINDEKGRLMREPIHSFINISLMPFFTSFLPKIGFFLELIWYSQNENGILITSIFTPLQMFSIILGDWIFHFSAISFFNSKTNSKNQLFTELFRLVIVIALCFTILALSLTNTFSKIFTKNISIIEISSESNKYGYFIDCSLPFHIIAQFFLSYFTTYKSMMPLMIPLISIILQHVILNPISLYLVGASSIYTPLYTLLCDVLSIFVSIAALRYYDMEFQFSFSNLLVLPSKEFIKLFLENIYGLISCFLYTVFYYVLFYYTQYSFYNNSSAILQSCSVILHIVFLFESPAYSFRFLVFKASSILFKERNFRNINLITLVSIILCCLWFCLLLPIILIIHNNIFELLFYKSDFPEHATKICSKLYSIPIYTVWLTGFYIPFENVLAAVKTKFSSLIEMSKPLLTLIFGIYFIFTNQENQTRMMFSLFVSDIATSIIALILGMPYLSKCIHLRKSNNDETPLSAN